MIARLFLAPVALHLRSLRNSDKTARTKLHHPTSGDGILGLRILGCGVHIQHHEPCGNAIHGRMGNSPECQGTADHDDGDDHGDDDCNRYSYTQNLAPN